MTARDVARRVLERVAREQAWAGFALDGELQRAGLAPRDRRLATELVYGVLRHQTRLDRALAAHADLARTPPRVRLALRIAAYQLLLLRVPGYAAVDDAVGAVRQIGGAKLAGFANAVLRKLAAAGEPALPSGALERLEVEHSLPRWILDELAAVTDDPGAAAAGLCAPARLAGRANLRRGDRASVLALLVEEGAVVEAAGDGPGFFVDDLGDPGASPSQRAGRWTVQDLGAQRVGLACAPRAGQRVLDACAGVGGKATHLAEFADDGAAIDAVDRSATKLGLLEASARRLGLSSIAPRCLDLESANAGALAVAYDRIVLDAPCTGLGVLRRHPETKWRVSLADVARLAEVQARLLDVVVPRLARGGTLTYSVCTFTHAEGPGQIEAALRRHAGLRLQHAEQTWPHVDGADAFYLATVERA